MSATQIVTTAMLLGGAVFAQPADIIGWNGLPWGASKPSALAALRSFHVRECLACSGTDALVIDNYNENPSSGVGYQVKLAFLPKYGLASVTMTAPDDRDSVQNVLSSLTARYGRPGLRSEYDGDLEVTHTKWEWSKPHGRLSMSSGDGDGPGGVFTITYEARRDGGR